MSASVSTLAVSFGSLQDSCVSSPLDSGSLILLIPVQYRSVPSGSDSQLLRIGFLSRLYTPGRAEEGVTSVIVGREGMADYYGWNRRSEMVWYTGEMVCHKRKERE